MGKRPSLGNLPEDALSWGTVRRAGDGESELNSLIGRGNDEH